MIVAVNYANEPYRATQKYCTYSAYKYGVDKVYEYGPADIDTEFYNKNRNILEKKRGGGYWLWKPYVICKTLDKIDYGDYLLYIDSGSYFIRNINAVLKCMDENNDDLISFALPFIEKQWTKKEIINYFKCNENVKILDSCQRIATFIFMKKTDRTVCFMRKYLETAQHNLLITDDLNSVIQDPMFIENRHDQSLFSVLAKLEKIPVYKDPSEYGCQPELLSQSYPNAIFKIEKCDKGNYKQILVLHRKKKVTVYVRIMSYIRRRFNWKIYRWILNMQKKVYGILRG